MTARLVVVLWDEPEAIVVQTAKPVRINHIYMVCKLHCGSSDS